MRLKSDGSPYRQSGTGCVYQVKASGFWYMKYYRNGNPVVESTKQTTQKKAQRVLNATLEAIARNQYIAPDDRKTNVADLWERLIADYKANGQDTGHIESKWKLRIEAFFGNLQASQVSTDLLNAYITKYRAEGLETATLNRDMSALKRAFNLGYQCTPRKVQQIPVFPKRLKEAPPRKGFVDQATYNKKASKAGALWLRALLATGYAFGFRREELLSMRVKQNRLARPYYHPLSW